MTVSRLTLARGLARTFRSWLITAVAIVVAVIVLAIGANRPKDPVLSNVIDATGENGSGFVFVQGKVEVGSRCLKVLIADNDAKRIQGLQGRTSIPFDGMVFVYDHDVHFDFTMSKTLIPLDAAFYDARGRRVDLLHMIPCPGKGPNQCVRYHSRRSYRYVLETGPGGAGSGNLGACPA